MSYIAVGNNVTIKPHTMDEKTKGGIIIPDSVRKEQVPESGEVMSIGAAVKKSIGKELEFKVGDTVLFAKTGNTNIDDEGGLLSVPYQNIHCKKIAQ